MVKIGVISDWKRAERGNAWERLLKDIDPTIEVTSYPIADLIVTSVKKERRLRGMHEEQVLIINWDAANGDPEFGAHLCQRWLEHRRPEIIEWVRKGRVLLIESQTRLGVPSDTAYEAAVGKGELPTSGLEDPTKPLQGARSGRAARKTARFPVGHGFGSVEDVIVAREAYPDVEMFPKHTTGLLTNALPKDDSGPLLWRGVFRRSLPYTRRFPWISIMETEAKAPYRQSILQVAKVGDGAIFATTMMLAKTGQIDLVCAIIRCVDGNTIHLPNPVAAVERVNAGVKWFLAIFGGIAAALIVGRWGTLFGKLETALKAAGVPADAVTGWVQLLLLALGLAIVILGHRLFLRARKFFRDVVGA